MSVAVFWLKRMVAKLIGKGIYAGLVAVVGRLNVIWLKDDISFGKLMFLKGKP